jgi:hypothetical protein
MIIKLEFNEFLWLQNVCRKNSFIRRETCNFEVLNVLESAGLICMNEFYAFQPTTLGKKILSQHSPWVEGMQYLSYVANHQAKAILNFDRNQLYCYGKSPLNK